MKAKLTPWFPASVKPAREGVYQRMYDEGPAYCRWDGRWWSFGTLIEWPGACENAALEIIPAPNQGLDWRGLAKEPK